MRVLVLEDDRELADYVRRALEEEHYAVTMCFDGSSDLKATQSASQTRPPARWRPFKPVLSLSPHRVRHADSLGLRIHKVSPAVDRERRSLTPLRALFARGAFVDSQPERTFSMRVFIGSASAV